MPIPSEMILIEADQGSECWNLISIEQEVIREH